MGWSQGVSPWSSMEHFGHLGGFLRLFLWCPNCWQQKHHRGLGINGDTLTFRKPTLILVGTVLPWKVRMMVRVVILYPSLVIKIFCASLIPCSLKFSTMSSTGVNLSSLHRVWPLRWNYYKGPNRDLGEDPFFDRNEHRRLRDFKTIIISPIFSSIQVEFELPFYGLHVFWLIWDTKVIHKQRLVNTIPYTAGDTVNLNYK